MYKTFVKIILNDKKICDILKTCGIIINVPIHKKRKKQRGYDQSELIVKEIARSIRGLEYEKVLKKIKDNPKQSLQSREKRIENVKNAYEIVNKQIIRNKSLILFDDVYTSRRNSQ